MGADSSSERPIWQLVTAPGSDAQPSRLARLSGVLVGFVADGRAWVWLAAPDGSLTPVAWPRGYRARLDPLELLDAEGRCVARGGDVVRTAGGYTGAGVPHLDAFARMGVDGVFTAGGRPAVVTHTGIGADRGL
jgi:hypothetical protein